VQALGAEDISMADRAEWMLVKAGPAVLPQVRAALGSQNTAVRRRAIRIVAWQGDLDALQTLRGIQSRNPGDAELAWAIQKIQLLHPKLWSGEASAGQ
jgi:glycerophosphoryl diester phosphodiesterase